LGIGYLEKEQVGSFKDRKPRSYFLAINSAIEKIGWIQVK
jgi:hypothetical protein